jgi:hypothetical protein
LIKVEYAFEGASFGQTVFHNAQQALVPAVQELVRRVVTSPAFEAAMRTSSRSKE